MLEGNDREMIGSNEREIIERRVKVANEMTEN